MTDFNPSNLRLTFKWARDRTHENWRITDLTGDGIRMAGYYEAALIDEIERLRAERDGAFATLKGYGWTDEMFVGRWSTADETSPCPHCVDGSEHTLEHEGKP